MRLQYNMFKFILYFLSITVWFDLSILLNSAGASLRTAIIDIISDGEHLKINTLYKTLITTH